jgi:hypothetical protein
MTVLIAYQNALRSALIADTTLMSMVSGVFDYYPAGQALPYIAFAESSEAPNDAIGAATGSRTSDVTMTLEVVNDAPGRQTTLNVLDRIDVVLDTNLTLSRGTAVGRPEFTINKGIQDETIGRWKAPIEVRQLITNI